MIPRGICDNKIKYRHVGNTWACYVTLRLHMLTDNEKNRLRYVTPKTPTPQKKKIVTLRNDVICTRPISKKLLVSLRNDVKWRRNDVEMTSKCPRPQKCFAPLRDGNRPYAHDPPKKILGYVTLALNMPMPTSCFLVLVTLRSESCPSIAYMTVFG